MAPRQKTSFNVRIDGIAQLDRMAEGMDRAQAAFLTAAGERLREQLVAATPRRTGRMAASWRLAVDAPHSIVLANDHPGAKARDRGAHIEPTRRKVLAFRGPDGMVFVRGGIKQEATRFTRKGMRGRGRIMQEEFDSAMDAMARGRVGL